MSAWQCTRCGRFMRNDGCRRCRELGIEQDTFPMWKGNKLTVAAAQFFGVERHPDEDDQSLRDRCRARIAECGV